MKKVILPIMLFGIICYNFSATNVFWSNAETNSYSITDNPGANLQFSLSNTSRVNINLFDLQGKIVQNLISGKYSAGDHRTDLQGLDASGQPLPAGIYIVQFEAEQKTLTRKVSLIR